jgi:hypothetical protein
MSMNPNRVLRVITILCFLFISAAVIIASSSVATGYELSIYTETPATVWVLLFTCVSGGTLLICHYAITGKEVNHLGLVIGPLGLANLTVLLLPTLRGYYLYASPDSLAHGHGVHPHRLLNISAVLSRYDLLTTHNLDRRPDLRLGEADEHKLVDAISHYRLGHSRVSSLMPGSHRGETPMFLLEIPGDSPVARKVATMMDVAPTVLDLLGLADMEAHDGRSLFCSRT